jgi:inward rectifier potassium channel
VVVGSYFGANAVFAALFFACGGIANARPGSLRDAFFFSVQTLGTIGYGAMYPLSDTANVLVAIESTVGLVLTALVTGLVFAKFSRPTARVLFSRKVTIAPMNGMPTLSFRVGNRRKNRILGAQVQVALVRTERTAEGKEFYRMVDLRLSRDRILSLARSWSVLHPIDEASPLWGQTPESLAEQAAELQVSVSGMDDTWMQAVHASHTYYDLDLVWGARHADILRDEGTVMTLDLAKFDDLEPTEPTAAFPYPRAGR